MNNHSLDLTTAPLCFRLMGLTDQTLHYFEAGYYPGDKGNLKHYLAVRLHDHDGQSLGYIRQSLQQWARAPYGAWKMSPDMTKTPFLFNWHRLDQQNQQHLIITSSPWMVMKLFQAGYRQVLSLIRLTITAETIRQIDRFQAIKICLLLGGDTGSRGAAQWIEKRLKTNTQIIFLPSDVSPEQLSQMELTQILEPYINTDCD